MLERARFLPLVLLLTTWAQAEEIPFPTKRSTILRKGGVVYYVEGRQRIPWGCEISCQKDVKIVGRGAGAVLEVEGSLQIHGVTDREVIIENLWIEPAPKFEDIHLDMVIFRGGGGLRTPKGQACRGGRVFIENADFQSGTTINVGLESGKLDLTASTASDPVVIRGMAAKDMSQSSLKVVIRGCVHMGGTDGLAGGLFVSGCRDLTVRINRLGGATSEFVDNTTCLFDGNKVNSAHLIFRQTRSGRMSKTKLLKCDIYSTKVTLAAPEAKKERVTLDKCWFKGLTKKKQILEQVITDGEDGGSGAYAKFLKINKRAQELAGAVDR